MNKTNSTMGHFTGYPDFQIAIQTKPILHKLHSLALDIRITLLTKD